METEKTTIQRTKINLFFEKVNKFDKLLDKLEKERGKRSKLITFRDEKGVSQQIPMIFRESLGNTSKTYVLINWKV
jgi:hypothetical protein